MNPDMGDEKQTLLRRVVAVRELAKRPPLGFLLISAFAGMQMCWRGRGAIAVGGAVAACCSSSRAQEQGGNSHKMDIMKIRMEMLELKLALASLEQSGEEKQVSELIIPDSTASSMPTATQALLLHDDVLGYCHSEGGEEDILVERLIELARLQVIELGESEAGLRSIDTAMEICPLKSKQGVHERLWMEGIAAFYTGDWARGARHFEIEMGVNGSDVEVPVWRWLCDAHNPEFGPETARKRLMPLKVDRLSTLESCFNACIVGYW